MPPESRRVGTGHGSTPSYGNGKQALLEATVKVVANSGLRNLTYRAVAEEAGVAHALVRHHFGSRECLLEAALRYSLDECADALAAATELATIETFVDSLTESVLQQPNLQAFQYELMLESRRNPAFVQPVRRLYSTYQSMIADALNRIGFDPDPNLTLLVFAAIDGLILQQLVLGDKQAADGAIERLRTMLADARRRNLPVPPSCE